jgi:cobalt-zinc-cadmium efflux system protein
LIISIVISGMVIKSGRGILKKSLHILMQWVPDGIDLEEVKKYIKSFDGVENVHDLHIWNIDSNDIYLVSHIIIDNDQNIRRNYKKYQPLNWEKI